VVVLGPKSSTGRETIEEALGPLSSPSCNAHLLLLLLDLMIVTVFPELGVQMMDREAGSIVSKVGSETSRRGSLERGGSGSE